jgi:mannose-6-phosphate isomerase-like protein (cupin superfamily)
METGAAMNTVEIKRLKRGFFEDPKSGWSAYPFIQGMGERGADLRGVHVVAIYPGQTRGNHYHENTNEVLFMFAGSGTFYWEEEGCVHEHLIVGSPTVITIPAGIKHAFTNNGHDPVYLIALRDGEYDQNNPDVVKTELI